MKQIKNEEDELCENRILYEFAKRFDITPMQLIKHNKSSYISDARQLYCKLRHDKHGISYSEAGREIKRTHATVKYSVTRINNLLKMNDKKIIEMWNKIKDISFLENTANQGLYVAQRCTNTLTRSRRFPNRCVAKQKKSYELKIKS